MALTRELPKPVEQEIRRRNLRLSPGRGGFWLLADPRDPANQERFTSLWEEQNKGMKKTRWWTVGRPINWSQIMSFGRTASSVTEHAQAIIDHCMFNKTPLESQSDRLLRLEQTVAAVADALQRQGTTLQEFIGSQVEHTSEAEAAAAEDEGTIVVASREEAEVDGDGDDTAGWS